MTIPYLYQLQDVRKVARLKGRCLIAEEMGLGKTFISLLFAIRHPELRPIVAIVPAGLKWQWQNEAAKHAGIAAEVLTGTNPTALPMIRNRPMVIASYNILGQRQGEKYGKGWLSWLKEIKPKLIILDEVQHCGNNRAKQTAWTKELCRDVPNILALSGTPLTNRPLELFPILNILWPEVFPSFFKYCFRYCNPKKIYGRWDFSGASRLPELHQKLIDLGMIRRRKEEVLTQLPKKQRIIVPLELLNRKEYNHAVNDFLGWLRQYNPTKLTKAMRAERLTRLGYLIRLVGQLKLPSVMEWIDNFLNESDEKLIVFAVHKTVIGPLEDKYRKLCIKVDGSIVGRDRQLAIDKFLLNNSCRLFLGNIKAAGIGWNAKGVSTVAFAELPWTPGAINQCEDRCHGIGRGQEGVHSSAYYLLARQTIETKMAEVIQRKQQILSQTLDGSDKEEVLDLADMLTQTLLKG